MPYPSPCDHCSLCPWRERCAAKRLEDDHLSAVAGITRQQIARLEAAEVRTVAALGALPASIVVPKIAPETLAKLSQSTEIYLTAFIAIALPHSLDPKR